MSPMRRQSRWSPLRVVVPLLVAAISAGVIVSPRMGESARLDRMIADAAAEVDRGRAAAEDLRELRASNDLSLRFAADWRRAAIGADDDERKRFEYLHRIEVILGIRIRVCLEAERRETFMYGGGDEFLPPEDHPIRLDTGLWSRRLRIEATGTYVGLINLIEIIQFGPRVMALRAVHMDTVGEDPESRRVLMTVDWLIDPDAKNTVTGVGK